MSQDYPVVELILVRTGLSCSRPSPESSVRWDISRIGVLTGIIIIQVPSAYGAQSESGHCPIWPHVPHEEIADMDGRVEFQGQMTDYYVL